MLGFEEVSSILSPYWTVERLPGLEFEYRIEPHPEMGGGVFRTRQSGFGICSSGSPAKPLLAICKILEGQLSVEINGCSHYFSSEAQHTFLVSNSDIVRAEHNNLTMLFYPVCCDNDPENIGSLHDLLTSMMQDFHLSFEDIYKAINTYHGLGPLRAASKDCLIGSLDLYILCIMLKNFYDGNFHLKNIAAETNLSVSSIARHEVAGRKVKDWANTFKINKWRILRNDKSSSEIAEILGYSSSEKLRDFLRRQGVLSAPR